MQVYIIIKYTGPMSMLEGCVLKAHAIVFLTCILMKYLLLAAKNFTGCCRYKEQLVFGASWCDMVLFTALYSIAQ